MLRSEVNYTGISNTITFPRYHHNSIKIPPLSATTTSCTELRLLPSSGTYFRKQTSNYVYRQPMLQLSQTRPPRLEVFINKAVFPTSTKRSARKSSDIILHLVECCEYGMESESGEGGSEMKDSFRVSRHLYALVQCGAFLLWFVVA